jgi:hypothetical protein
MTMTLVKTQQQQKYIRLQRTFAKEIAAFQRSDEYFSIRIRQRTSDFHLRKFTIDSNM